MYRGRLHIDAAQVNDWLQGLDVRLTDARHFRRILVVASVLS